MQETVWHECLMCGDTIANQVCYRCMQKEVATWLFARNPRFVASLNRASEFFDSYLHEGSDCALCGQNLNVCSKCYCTTVHKALRKNRILASEFLEFAAGKGFMLASVKGVLNLQMSERFAF